MSVSRNDSVPAADWNRIVKNAAKRLDTDKTSTFPLGDEEVGLISSIPFQLEIRSKILGSSELSDETKTAIEDLLGRILLGLKTQPAIPTSYLQEINVNNDASRTVANALKQRFQKQFPILATDTLAPTAVTSTSDARTPKTPQGAGLLKKTLGLGTAGLMAAAAYSSGALSGAPQTGLQTAPVFAPAVSATPFPTVAGRHYFKEPSTALVSLEAPSFLLDTLAKQGALDTETLARQRAFIAAQTAKQRVLQKADRRRAKLQRAQEAADVTRSFPETEDDVRSRAEFGESVTEKKAEEEMAPIRQAEKAAKAAELQAFQSSLNEDFIDPTFPHAFSNLLTMQKARVIADFVKGPLTNLATSYKYVPLSEIIELHLIGNDAEQTLENYDKWVASLDINADSLPAKAIKTDDKKLIHTNYAEVVNYFLNFLPTEALANEIDNQIITDIRTNLIALRDAPWLYGTEYPVFDTTKRNQIISNLNSAVGRIRSGSLNSALRSLGGRVQRSRSKRSRSRRHGKSRRHRSRSRSGKRKSHKSPRYYAYM